MIDNLIDIHLIHFFSYGTANKADFLSSAELLQVMFFLKEKDLVRKEQHAIRLIDATLTQISRTSVMQHLFKDYVNNITDFERGIIHLSSDYQSHLIHAIYVYLLGFYFEALNDYPYQELNMDYFDSFYSVKRICSYPYIRNDERAKFRKRWAYTVFFHDMHYPTERSLKYLLNQARDNCYTDSLYSLNMDNPDDLLYIPKMASIRIFFMPNAKEEFLFNDDALMIIANRLAFRIGDYPAETIYSSLKQELISGLKKSRWEHGLIGAIYSIRYYTDMLAQYLSTDDDKSMRYKSRHELIREYKDFTDAIAASALHNVKHYKKGIFNEKFKISRKKLPLLYTLILADEFQCWNRSLKPKRRSMEKTDHMNLTHIELREKVFAIWDSMLMEYALQKQDKNCFKLPYFNQCAKRSSQKPHELFYVKGTKGDKHSWKLIFAASNISRSTHIYRIRKLTKSITDLKYKRISDRKLKNKSILHIKHFKFGKFVKFINVLETNRLSLDFYRFKETNDKETNDFEDQQDLKLYQQLWEEYKQEHQTLGAVFDYFMQVEDTIFSLIKNINEENIAIFNTQQQICKLIMDAPTSHLSKFSEKILPLFPMGFNEMKLTDKEKESRSLKMDFEVVNTIHEVMTKLFDSKEIAQNIKDIYMIPYQGIEDKLLDPIRELIGLLDMLKDKQFTKEKGV